MRDPIRLLGKLPAVVSDGDERTGEIGAALARFVYPGLSVLLTGDLGAGKTTLVRAVGAALGVTNVKSPTFAIESVHRMPETGAGIASFIHADLYRIEDAGEFSEQFEESLADGALLFVEWGERWNGAPVADRWNVEISLVQGGIRLLEMSAYGERALIALSKAHAEIFDTCR